MTPSRNVGIVSFFVLVGCQGKPPAAPSAAHPTPTQSPPSASASPPGASAEQSTPPAAAPATSAPPAASASVSASASVAVNASPLSVESNEQGATTVKIGSASVRCEAVHTLQAGATTCTLDGSRERAFVGFGLSDSSGDLVCSRKRPGYSYRHGGGWDVGPELVLHPGAQGARVRLAKGVEVWLGPDLRSVEVSNGKTTATLKIDLEPVPATVSVRQAAGASGHGTAPLLLDLTTAWKAANSESTACVAPKGP